MKIGSWLIRTGLMIAAAVVLASGVTRAQSDATALPGPPPGPGHVGRGPMPFDEFGFVGFEAGIGGKTVTGAPFTATLSTQSSQTLADGNQIQRSTTGTFARDSHGRVRREMTLPAIGAMAISGKTPPHAVFISDPVAGVNYIVHTDEKTADQLPIHRWNAGKNGGAEAGFKNRFKGQETTTDLGTQTINGVPAQGTRITRTIPAGEIGNTKPIVIVTEHWYSPELQTYVMTKRTDPLMGDTVYQLTNIRQQEPDASLFQVPSGYPVSQGGTRGAARFHGTPAAAPPEQ